MSPLAPTPARTGVSVELRARFFRGLGNPTRLALLDALRAGERCVNELVLATGLGQSSVSGHLASLRACGLVEAREEWRHTYYRLAGPHVAHLLAETDLVLAVVAGRVAACEGPEQDAER